jgi:glutathione S-transferase
MSGEKDDDAPVSLRHFYEFKAYVEGEIAGIKKEQEWVRRSLERLEDSIERYKWWIIGGFFSASTLFALMVYLLKVM